MIAEWRARRTRSAPGRAVVYTSLCWRCVFSSRWLAELLPGNLPPAWQKTCAAAFWLLFPDGCRICGGALEGIGRIPVCAHCLSAPQPLAAEYFCVCCRTPFRNRFPLDEQGRCPLCRLGLRGFDAAYSYGAYEGVLRELIHLFKYGRIRTLARPLGEYLAVAIPHDQRFDLIVPVPLHWRRRLARGFNQAALLAAAVARRYALPVAPAVRRRRGTPSQAGLTNAQRRANMAGAFRVRRPEQVRGRRVLLVDDVMTTGATAAACAAALKRAGASHVTLLTLARVDRRTPVVSPVVSPPPEVR